MKTNKGNRMGNSVVKTNRLNTAIQNLSLVEIRLIQVAIIDSRETQKGLSADTPLRITAKRYAEAFNVDVDSAYDVMLDAETTLFDRRFTFINEQNNPVKSRWVSQVEYVRGEGAIEIILTPAVVKEITRIDGKKSFFTEYMLEQTAILNSVYSVRLYELLVQHRTSPINPKFELEIFRGQLGLGVNDYKRLCDFKRRVLDHAVKEINNKTDLQVSYVPIKTGRSVVGYDFKVNEKPKQKTTDSTSNNFKELTAKTIELFGNKLANDNAFGSKYAKQGESLKEFEVRIKSELKDVKNQKRWLSDLIRVGYSEKRNNRQTKFH